MNLKEAKIKFGTYSPLPVTKYGKEGHPYGSNPSVDRYEMGSYKNTSFVKILGHNDNKKDPRVRIHYPDSKKDGWVRPEQIENNDVKAK